MKHFGDAHGSKLKTLKNSCLKPRWAAKPTLLTVRSSLIVRLNTLEEDRLKPTEPQIFSIFSYFFMIFE